MIFNPNSRTARIYRWFYNLNWTEMPSNLCPYFWKLVFMWAMIVPLTILSLPYQIWMRFGKEKWGVKICLSIAMYAALFCGFAMIVAISLFFTNYDTHGVMFQFAMGGLMSWLTVIIIGIVKLVKFLRKKINKPSIKIVKEPTPSIIFEFLKATYHRYCPKIEWKSNE